MELGACSWSFHVQFLFDKLAYKKAFRCFFLIKTNPLLLRKKKEFSYEQKKLKQIILNV